MEDNLTKPEYPPYILRKSDFSILKRDENNQYFFNSLIPTSNQNHYTLETLRDTYAGSFSPVYTKEEKKEIEELNKKYYNLYTSKISKNDGHGGSYSEFSGNFLDFLKTKDVVYTPSEFAWSDDKVYSKNDIDQLRKQILAKKEIIFRRCTVIDADTVSEMFVDFLKKNN